MQVLVDADNLPASRLRIVAAALAELPADALRVVVAGRSAAVDAVDWPAMALIVRIAGWQEADLALADAYRQLADLKVRELVDRRYDRLQSYGRYTDTKANAK